MRWLLALFLLLSTVACGGGGDGTGDSDDDVTPTVAEATPTTSPSPTATTAASPTSAGSPSAVASRQPGGTGIQPAGTPAASDPTPTRRPATVVTTPRPIARTPTPPISIQQPTETPVEDDDGVTLVLDDAFDDPAASLFFTGETEYGVVAAIDAGLYTLTVPEGTWQSIVAVDAGELGDALILVEAGLQGDGAVGVVGRWLANGDDTWTFYVCWLATDGRAGCHASISSEWAELFSVEAGTVPILEVNELYLSVVGDEVYFDVNDIEIGTIVDGSSAIGSWGLYAESFTGTSVAWYDRVTLATIDE
jgi:hypothetical protein